MLKGIFDTTNKVETVTPFLGTKCIDDMRVKYHVNTNISFWVYMCYW